MGSIDCKWDEDQFSEIGDKGEIGFIDYQDDKSVCSYAPEEEGPIYISAPFPFVNGKPQSVILGETATHPITIKNTTDEGVDLWTKIYASNPENSFTLSLMEPPSAKGGNSNNGFLESYSLEDRMVQAGDSLTIWLNCKPQEIGLYTSVVHFDVGNERIERVAFLLAEDRVSRSLASQKPYSRTVRKKPFTADTYVAGSRPIRKGGRPLKNRLPKYDIPQELRELIQSKQIPDDVKEGLTRENYASYFKTLLAMEEIQMEEDMRSYDMESVRMRKRGNLLSLVVPGLAERRPSLVYGDYIFVRLANGDEAAQLYQGYIHRVEADEVYLKFDSEQQFHNYHSDQNLYNVYFTYNRVNMRRQYHAVDAAESLEMELLFPSECFGNRLVASKPLRPITRYLNEEQKYSVEMILGCRGGPPYVIYGPPGTGKTKTIVEAILQLYRNWSDARILACAPSNSAADHLLEKLLCEKDVNIRHNDIFRLNATSRPFQDIKPEHTQFSFFEENLFKCPPLYALSRYRIVISTYMSACTLNAEGVQRGHFSHIFLDEAGQASEPETMIPISNLCQRNTVVVLAGDPKQLGPVIYSRDAIDFGLGKSYLERLFECEYYNSGNGNYIAKLLSNYRCHPEILRLPSDLFYDAELIASKESNDDTTSLLSSVNLLPGREFPVLFFGIQGCDEREGNNPSWFNRIEASKVVEVTNKLICEGNLNEVDIGIITPYRQQVLKLKKAFDDLGIPDIKVGSVEQFQGQERRVIVVSTVRSTVKHNEFDRAHCLGFLSNPRRFNVAITRAISLLIIIGNPHIICKDAYWSTLLWYCVDNNSYQGCGLPERVEFVDEYEVQEDGENNANYQNENPQYNDYENANSQYTKNGESEQNYFQTETQKPGTDEAEWSDGWK